MAGHSKWANIKRHKAKQDAVRGKLYTKLIREITVSARLGGGDANSNSRLRIALDKAYEANMTKDVIDRAVKRGVGGLEGQDLEEIRYEGYGVMGIAVMVDCMTNNRNRTVGDVRHIFTKYGGNLGTDGSVAYLFMQRGQLVYGANVNEEKLIECALELDAIDVLTHENGQMEVVTAPETYARVKQGLEAKGFHPENAEITMRAATTVQLTDKETAEKFLNLVDALEELDDVQVVYSNADMAESVLAELE